MKKIFTFLLPAFLLLISPDFVSAHPGGTDSLGCHTCRTNCSSWGLSYGEYHCHQSKGYTQPLDPISSTYGSRGTGYTSPAPNYSYPSYTAPSTPSCPFMSTYDSLSGSCKCLSGYIVDTDVLGNQTCTSGTSYCWKKFGYHSSYSSLNKSCSCDSGYEFDHSDQCVSSDDKCKDDYGRNARYNFISSKCECKTGYEFNGSTCEEKKVTCPENSYLSINGKCSCNLGYEVNDEKSACVKSCGINEIRSGSSCVCSDGYVKSGLICISHTQNCQKDFGDYSFGIKNIDGLPNTSSCYCDTGYEWNKAQTACVKSVVKIEIASTSKAVFKKDLKLNSRGDEVKKLQQKLAKEKIYKGKIDSVFGKQTEAAVKNYQKKNKIKATGKVDAVTREKLNKK